MNRPAFFTALLFVICCVAGTQSAVSFAADKDQASSVDASTLRGKVMCGYQAWFRCPGDASKLGWVHWSRNSKRLAPETLTFEMWPDVAAYPADGRFPAPGFTHPDGRAAELFSSDCAAVVQLHFEWMRDYGIDGAWLQQFLVDLPGGSLPERHPSRIRVVKHVARAAQQTGRAWAVTYDMAGMPLDKIYEVLIADWKRMVDEKVVDDPRYLREKGLPVVQVWGFYHQNAHNHMTPRLANQIIDFFKTPGPYAAYLAGGGDWNWRTVSDPEWPKFIRRFDAYGPWNVGNYAKDVKGEVHASMGYWRDDKEQFERGGGLWMPVVYPGFSWDNLTRKPAGSTEIPRRGGRFYWEQFHRLAELKVDTVYVAMFDEVDEGTAIFKVTSSPPVQGHFVGYEGLPSDWYLRLTGEGAKMLRGERPISAEIPIKP